MPQRGRGRLIVFEGGEGTGKSTQAAILADRLGAVLTREPGGTPLGEQLRTLLLDPAVAPVEPRTEFLVMAAARAQHTRDVIAPALGVGRDVVCDRFSHSSLAYQGYGRGLDLAMVRATTDWATDGLWPDLVLLLELAVPRVGADPDRLELEDAAFHRRVVAGFRALAEAEPERWRVVDGDGSVGDVAARVWAAVEAAVGVPPGPGGP